MLAITSYGRHYLCTVLFMFISFVPAIAGSAQSNSKRHFFQFSNTHGLHPILDVSRESASSVLSFHTVAGRSDITLPNPENARSLEFFIVTNPDNPGTFFWDGSCLEFHSGSTQRTQEELLRDIRILERKQGLVLADGLQANHDDTLTYVARISEFEGVTEMMSLANKEDLEEAWLFFPEMSLWVEFGRGAKDFEGPNESGSHLFLDWDGAKKFSRLATRDVHQYHYHPRQTKLKLAKLDLIRHEEQQDQIAANEIQSTLNELQELYKRNAEALKAATTPGEKEAYMQLHEIIQHSLKVVTKQQEDMGPVFSLRYLHSLFKTDYNLEALPSSIDQQQAASTFEPSEEQKEKRGIEGLRISNFVVSGSGVSHYGREKRTKISEGPLEPIVFLDARAIQAKVNELWIARGRPAIDNWDGIPERETIELFRSWKVTPTDFVDFYGTTELPQFFELLAEMNHTSL